MLNQGLPFSPEDVVAINSNIGMAIRDDKILFVNGSGVIYLCDVNDLAGIRLASGMLCNLKLARAEEVAATLGYARSSIFRNQKILKEKGVAGFERIHKTGPRRGHKLTGEKLQEAQSLMDRGMSVNAVGKSVGVNESTIRNAIVRGRLKKKKSTDKSRSNAGSASPVTRSERDAVDKETAGGIGVKRHLDRVLATKGMIIEATPQFKPSESVFGGGVLLALPEILDQGLLNVGKSVYDSLKIGFFGLRSLLLTLCFMSLLRIQTVEQLSKHSPGELGILLGLDRFPEMKTLRRKLKEVMNRNLSREFSCGLSTHWADKTSETLGYLYIDGHVRAYTGRKHKFPKTHVARRRLCMPAVTDFWVNDAESSPLFYVTTEANDGLLSVINNDIIPGIRSLLGDDERRVTIIFDREGWSPTNFEKWHGMGFDVITYRKFKYEYWAPECFEKIEVSEGVSYELGFQFIELRKGFWMKEVRRLCSNGHQTSILSSKLDISIKEIACRMFKRWNQENFFKYMRREFALDHLCTYDVEDADADRLVVNPELKRARKELAALRKELKKLKSDYAEKIIGDGKKEEESQPASKQQDSGHEILVKINELSDRCNKMSKETKEIPERVPLKIVIEKDKIVRHKRERKIFTDYIKMTAYRTETALLQLIEPYFSRSEEEGRRFLQAMFQTFADITPDEENQCLRIKFHSMTTQRDNRILSQLCHIITERKSTYPGTNIQLVFEGP